MSTTEKIIFWSKVFILIVVVAGMVLVVPPYWKFMFHLVRSYWGF